MAKKPKLKAEPTDERLNRASIATWETLRETPPPPPFSPKGGIAAFQSWVAAAASINAQAVAAVPLRLYVKKRKGQKCLFQTRPISRKRHAWLMGDQRAKPSVGVVRKSIQMGEMEEVVDAHPLTDLLGSVNPFFNGFDFSTFRILCQELTGNAYTLMIRSSDNDPPQELWPLLPQFVTIIPSRDSWSSGYLYSQNPTDPVRFERQDVIHFKQVSVKSYLYGQGKVEKAWGVIKLNESNHAMDQAMSDNYGRPDYAVIMEGATNDQAAQMQVELDRRLRGRHKAGRSLVVGGPKTTLMPLNFPPKDLAGRDDVVEEIAAVFGVPVSMLKANDPNLASSKAGYAMWREATILPLCRLDEQALNQQLVPLYSDDLMLAYDNPVPDDEAAELAETTAYINLGLQTRNEWRTEEGFEPVADPMADQLLVNGQPLGGYAPLAPAGPVVNVNQPAAADAAPAAPAANADGAAPDAGIAAVERIAGVDAERAVAMCDAVSAGISNPVVVRIALVGMGFTEEQANAMVDAAVAFKPAAQEVSDDNGSSDSSGGADGNGGTDDSTDGDVGKAVGGADAGGKVAASGHADGSEGAPTAKAESGHESGMAGEDGEVVEVIPWDIPAGMLSHRHLSHGTQSMAQCCPHHKGEAADTVRDDEKDSPVKAAAVRMADVFAKQRQKIANMIAAEKSVRVKELTKPTIEEALAEFNKELDDILRPFMGQVTATGGAAGDAKLAAAGKPAGPDSYDPFDVHNPKVSEYLDSYTVRLRKEIQEYSGEAIAQYVARSIEGGKSTAEIAAGLREEASAAGGSMSPNRAEMIARTESARGYVEGQRMAWQESGVVQGKRWMLAPDACPFCEAMAAQFNAKNVGLDEPFMVKGSTLTAADGSVMVLDYSDVQGPPLHPNDRCDLEPIL